MIKNVAEWLGITSGAEIKVIASESDLESIGLDNTYLDATGIVISTHTDYATVEIKGEPLRFEYDMIEWCDPLVNNDEDLADKMWQDLLEVN